MTRFGWFWWTLMCPAAWAGVDVGRLQPQDVQATLPPPWRVVQIDAKVPPTRYRVAEVAGVTAFEAQAEASMALLARPLPPALDLRRTPVLCWRWRIQAVLQGADLNTRQGDDYAARVYVAFALPPDQLDLGTRLKLRLGRAVYGDLLPDAALNYVWDNQHPEGTEAPNAYTDRTRMRVQRTGNALAGRWVNERRDLLKDAQRLWGTDAVQPTLLAVATDTDNTGESAQAAFADLHFVAPEAACQWSQGAEPSR